MSLFKVRRRVIYSLYITCVHTLGVDAALEHNFFYSPLFQLSFTDCYFENRSGFIWNSHGGRLNYKPSWSPSCSTLTVGALLYYSIYTCCYILFADYCRVILIHWIKKNAQSDFFFCLFQSNKWHCSVIRTLFFSYIRSTSYVNISETSRL